MTNQTPVIPSEVEAATQSPIATRPGFQSRGETEEEFHGVLRLRYAALRMTIRHWSFVIPSALDIRHWSLISFARFVSAKSDALHFLLADSARTASERRNHHAVRAPVENLEQWDLNRRGAR